MSRFAAPLALAVALSGAAAAQQDAPPPRESGVEERVEVQLVEVKVIVTDKDGNPVTDIRPDEVRVQENGEPQKLAFFELVSEHGLLTDHRTVTRPVPVYDARGEVTRGDTDVVLPPKPVRRVIFVFDPRNSRMRVRDEWREAALAWARDRMQPGDQAGVVVVRTYPDWVLPLTADRDAAAAALHGLDLYTNIPNRSRRDEMTEFMMNLQSLCVDNVKGRLNESVSGGTRGTDLSADSIGCAYEMSRPLAFEWAEQTKESVAVLEFLSGQLAAIPGEKIVILFSEGIIDDPAQVLINSWLSVFPYNQVDIAANLTRLGRNTQADITELHERAQAADVVFFTLDTRHPSEGSASNNLEQTSASQVGNLGFNPWAEMYEATRSTLSALAYATGGRPYYGGEALEAKVEQAASSFFAIYTLGYYRSQPWGDRGKVNIKIDRRKLTLQYDKTPPQRPHQPALASMELVVGRPQPGGDGRQSLPLALLTPIDQLPLRAGAGGRGCEIGVFIQAVRPNGEVVAETHEIVSVVLTKEQLQNMRGKQWQHMLELDVPEGPMRLRARLSDDRFEILADRSIDVTIELGDVKGGLASARVE